MKSAQTILNESSITRIIAHNQIHDCAIVTAYRTCNTKKLNEKNNKALGYALNRLGYGATKVLGTYEEEIAGISSKEHSWFVVNLNDDLNFIDKIIEFGKTLNQDSVLIIPKNGFFKPIDVYLEGTNENEFCPLGEKIHATDVKFGKKENKMLTIIKHKPFYFIFEDLISENFLMVPKTNSLSTMQLIDSYVNKLFGKII